LQLIRIPLPLLFRRLLLSHPCRLRPDLLHLLPALSSPPVLIQTRLLPLPLLLVCRLLRRPQHLLLVLYRAWEWPAPQVTNSLPQGLITPSSSSSGFASAAAVAPTSNYTNPFAAATSALGLPTFTATPTSFPPPISGMGMVSATNSSPHGMIAPSSSSSGFACVPAVAPTSNYTNPFAAATSALGLPTFTAIPVPYPGPVSTSVTNISLHGMSVPSSSLSGLASAPAMPPFSNYTNSFAAATYALGLPTFLPSCVDVPGPSAVPGLAPIGNKNALADAAITHGAFPPSSSFAGHAPAPTASSTAPPQQFNQFVQPAAAHGPITPFASASDFTPAPTSRVASCYTNPFAAATATLGLPTFLPTSSQTPAAGSGPVFGFGNNNENCFPEAAGSYGMNPPCVSCADLAPGLAAASAAPPAQFNQFVHRSIPNDAADHSGSLSPAPFFAVGAGGLPQHQHQDQSYQQLDANAQTFQQENYFQQQQSSFPVSFSCQSERRYSSGCVSSSRTAPPCHSGD
jgi:hypothetical protein